MCRHTIRALGLLLLIGVIDIFSIGLARAGDLVPGDVLVGQDTFNTSGTVRQYRPDGTFVGSLETTVTGYDGSSQQTGMCFDAQGNLYTTNFLAFSLSKFDSHGALLAAQYIDVTPGTPNSCVFDAAGFLYVGLSDADGIHHTGEGGGGLLKFDLSGPTPARVATYSPAPEARGTDWIDLAADQCTLVYTSIGTSIKRFDVCGGVQLPDFCAPCDDGAGGQVSGPLFALRITLDGTGILVADNGIATAGLVHRYDGDPVHGTGAHAAGYVGEDLLGSYCGVGGDAACFFPFSLNLDPDGATFWTADNVTSEVFRFDLGSGAPVASPFCGGETCDSSSFITGVAVVGELTAATQSGDVSVVKTAVADRVNPGDTVGYTIAVTANGPGSSANVVLTDPLPAGLSWTVGGPDAAACSPVSPVAGGTTLTCAFGTLLKHASKTITLSATATGANCPGIGNTASVSAVRDRDSSNNSSGRVDIAVTCSSVRAAITAADKVYDATTAATITGCTLTGVDPADDVSCSATDAAFDSPNVGGGKPVSATVSLTGAAASKYVLESKTAQTTASITPATASVMPNAASKAYGAPDPTLTGTLSGFLAGDGVTASYSRVAGETVTGGPYTISATLSPAGVLGNYNIAYNTASFTINKVNASVTPNAASKNYGAPDPSLTGTLSGFLASDGVTATYSRTAGESVAGGPYTISATLSPAAVLGNYNITYGTANFTIDKVNASVTPNAASKSYGASDPTLTGTLSGFLASDGVTATYSRTAGESVAGSPYTISATLSPAAVLGNYNITYNTASFTINKVNASVTPNAASKSYGDPDPALTGTLSGFAGGDGITATYTRSPGESVGGNPYTISATLSPATALANYDITYNTAGFTINKASASVTPSAANKSYGSADPVLTGTLNGFLASDAVTATYTRTAGENVAGGPYTISATLSPTAVLSNYNVTYNTASLTITPASASVTPNAASKTYNATDPTLTGTLSGFRASDGVTATYTRTAGESVGNSPYVISATLSPAAVLGNYNITYNTASFTINKANASVTPNAASKIYGTADPTFTGSIAGFFPADGVVAAFTRTPGESVAGSPYVIGATLSPVGVLGNYAITYNAAAFTITPATPLISWADPADIYYPTPLGDTQLDAQANVPGTFAYTPQAGTVLSPGSHQLLSVLFTPTDNTDYTTASAEVHINVLETVSQTADCPTTITSNFNGTAIGGGRFIWFNSVLGLGEASSSPVTVQFTNSKIQFSANGLAYSLDVPDAVITFSPTATTATAQFDATNNRWVTTVPSSLPGNTFLTGLPFLVPVNFPGGINPVTWSGTFSTDTPGVSIKWQWAAAVYTQFSADQNQLGVKPVDDNRVSAYKNSDHAGTPEVYKSKVLGGARGGGGSNYTGSYSATKSCQ